MIRTVQKNIKSSSAHGYMDYITTMSHAHQKITFRQAAGSLPDTDGIKAGRSGSVLPGADDLYPGKRRPKGRCCSAQRAAGVRLPPCPFLLYMANPLSERTYAAVCAAADASGEAGEASRYGIRIFSLARRLGRPACLYLRFRPCQFAFL